MATELTEQDLAMAIRSGVGVASNPEFADGVIAERPREGGQEIRALSVDEVKGILSREISDSIGGVGSEIAREQQRALDYYYGKKLGNEQRDRSQVVLMDVLEVVEWAMPSLMRMFTGSAKVVQFKPKRAEDQRKADLATAYVNHVFVHEMDGFQILYDWFKTALLEKNGIVKVYFDNRQIPMVERYSGLTYEEVIMVLDRDGVEPTSLAERTVLMQDVDTGLNEEVKLHDIELQVMKDDRRIRVDAIPPEEFLIARRSAKLNDDTPFSAHRKKVTISELVAQGYPADLLAALPQGDMGPEFDPNRSARRSDDENYPSDSGPRTDVASREIWTTECYARVDEDGDGYSELRKFLVVGDSPVYIIDDEQINHNPFCSITPIPMPHKFYGQSLADLVTDLQVIRSTILRQMLDHLYLANNPRMAITEGMVEIDDLLTVRPGGLVRQRAPGSIEPMITQDLPRDTFPVLQYLEQVRSNRTGVMAHGQDLDAGMLSNTTAAAVASLEGAKQQKIELIARIFASTGLKQLFGKMFEIMATNDTKQRQVRLSGEWMEIDPSTFDFEFDVEVEVGLGAGKAGEQIQALNGLMTIQGQMIEQGGMNYLVTPKNIYNAATRMAEAMGYPNPDLFFQDPDGAEPPPPAPDPDMEKLKVETMKAQSEAELGAGEMQLKTLREKNIVDHRASELALKEKVDLERLASQERIARGSQDAQVQSALVASTGRLEGEGEPEEDTEEEE
jgi:hypothetical protein